MTTVGNIFFSKTCKKFRKIDLRYCDRLHSKLVCKIQRVTNSHFIKMKTRQAKPKRAIHINWRNTGAIYKSAGLRSVQAADKKRRPLVSDSRLSGGFEKAKAKARSKLYCIQTSDMEDQFQVPAILCSLRLVPLVFLFLSWDGEELGRQERPYPAQRMFRLGCRWCWLPPVQDLGGNCRNTPVLIESRIDGTWNYSQIIRDGFYIVQNGKIIRVKFRFYVSISINCFAD